MNGHQVLVTIDRTNLDNLWTLHICTIISWHLSYLSFTSYYFTLQCKHMKQYLKRTAPLSKLSYTFTRQLLPLSSNSVELSTATLADQKHLLQPPSDVFNVSWRRSIQLGSSEMGRAFNVCGIELHDQTETTFSCRHANANPRLKTAPLKFMTLVTERKCAKTRYFE